MQPLALILVALGMLCAAEEVVSTGDETNSTTTEYKLGDVPAAVGIKGHILRCSPPWWKGWKKTHIINAQPNSEGNWEIKKGGELESWKDLGDRKCFRELDLKLGPGEVVPLTTNRLVLTCGSKNWNKGEIYLERPTLEGLETMKTDGEVVKKFDDGDHHWCYVEEWKL
ncbi:hypothetical protein GQ602_006593 [Ophiocordyceps camponoti-floridani]|uniref:Uncharacterized protein n=1 Tax=Ophiocordyceps camponoti-floridani TaxID=2030778 RepID=A0A8H4VAY3_9HYPO|nr:hypothetical protein GQ602_006593 [Ophiocordyceps camponoti-floridani]